MRPTAYRAAGLALALVALAAAGAGATRAASPSPEPTIGGRLDVAPTVVVVTSTGSLRQVVTLTVDPPAGATLTPDRLELAPGESARIDVAGPAAGIVAAAFSARATGGQTVGIVLRAPFRPTAAPPGAPRPLLPIILGLASFLAAMAALWAVRRRRRA